LKILIITGILAVYIRYSSNLLYAQTCCSGGVPLANNIGGLPPADKSTFQVSVNFDGNYLKTLKEGNIKLDDHSKDRTTYSVLLTTTYTFSNRLTIETLFSGIRKKNKIININEIK